MNFHAFHVGLTTVAFPQESFVFHPPGVFHGHIV